MRSRPFKVGLRERIADRAERHLDACRCPRKPTAILSTAFGDALGTLLRGTGDCSRHRCGRARRLWWRMKSFARP